MSNSESLFIHSLADRFPMLKSSFNEHIEDNNGAVLPHVYLGIVAQGLVRLMKEEAQFEFVEGVLNFIEEQFETGSPQLDELISVSFIELLSPYDDDDRKVFDMLPKKMLREAKAIWG